MLKDSRYAIDLAERAGLSTPAIRCVSGQMAALDEQGLGESDFSILNAQFSGE
jgi:3-hydroxyisobutyrate dehydrogenase-like beta-hydroxyacid dehydrogenase